MVMRRQLGALFLCESQDDGNTWSKPECTGLRAPESCPDISRVPGAGDLLMVWSNSPYDPACRSHCGKRSPLIAAIFCDGGRTWASVRDIEDDPGRAFSNPGCRFISSGTHQPHAPPKREYGTHALVVALGYWVYYSSVVFIVNAEIGQLYRERPAERGADGNRPTGSGGTFP